MKDDKTLQASQAEQDVLRVLQAEQDAEQAVQGCENEARQVISDAHLMAQKINLRIDQRISDMEMRHSHKLNMLIREIEKQSAATLDSDSARAYDENDIRRIIDNIAMELCMGTVLADDATDSEK